MTGETPAPACRSCRNPNALLHAKGLCTRCYRRELNRERRGLVPVAGRTNWRSPARILNENRPCAAPGCPETIGGNGARGYCNRHYLQLRKRGHVDAVFMPPARPGVAKLSARESEAIRRAEQIADAERELAQVLEPYAHCVMPIERRVAFRRRIAQLRTLLAALRHAAEATPCQAIERRA